MCVEMEIGGCLDYVEPLQSSASYSVPPQWLYPLISTSEMTKGQKSS